MDKQTLNSYLSFKLGKEVFAINVVRVIEILELPEITVVPRSPVYMRGVINLRGNVLPVIDSRLKFGMDYQEDTINTCIVVMEIIIEDESVQIGAIVDSVQEVLEIDLSATAPPPSIGSRYKAEFIDGMVKIDENFIMLLNIDKVFSTEDVVALQRSTPETEVVNEE